MTATSEASRAPEAPAVAPRPPSAWRTQWWVALLAVYCLAFGVFAGARFITFDPSLSVAVARPGYDWHYPVLAIHVLTGAVAVMLAWLQVWPWLRENHPKIHRRIGWVYFLGGVIPSAVLAFPVSIMTIFGQGLRYAFLAMSTLWLITTVAGFVAVLQRRYEDHRRWMIRNVAMTTSTITVRFLQPLAIGATTWLLPGTYAGQEHLVMVEGAVAGLWASFVGHLLFVEWFVLRPRRRRRRAERSRRPVRAAAAGT